MTLRITILDGPEAGREVEFGDDVERVEIGRDPEHCQVVFPPDLTTVGRRHLGIRRSLGSYKLETKVQNPVLLDGREPFDDEPLGAAQEIQLGRSGPRLKVETTFEGALPLTEPVAAMSTPSRIAQGQRRTVQRIAVAIVALAVVVAGALGYVYWQQEEARREMLALVDQARALQPVEELTAEMLQRVASSTYLVVLVDARGEDAVGTAWSVGEGTLATNAHVAEAFHTLRPGQQLAVRATTDPYETIVIEDVLLHPDYARFQSAWNRFMPVRAGTDVSIETVGAPGAGYDVALMRTEPGARLNPPLEIADEQALAELSPGDAIAFAGFPMEMLAGGGVNPAAPTPQVQRGHITAVTDYFLLPGDAGERNLIQHSLPVTGGASGSPVVDDRGRVIAVISGMNITMLDSGMRAPSAAGVNFAQRASLVSELIDDRVEAVADARRAAWEAGFATFDDPAEMIPLAILANWSAQVGGEAVEIARHRGVIERRQGNELYVTGFAGLISEPGYYLAVAVSHGRHDIDMAFARAGEVFDRNVAYDWYPYLAYSHQSGPDVDIILFAENMPEEPDFELVVWRIDPAAIGSATDSRFAAAAP